MLRLFIGIPLPRSHRKQLVDLIDRLVQPVRSTVRWTNPDNGHLTLKYLGNVDEGRTDDLIAALAAITHPPFDIRLGACSCIPTPTRPRVLVMAAHKGARACQALAEAIEKTTVDLGFEPDDKQFRPHLTLGRIKKAAKDDWVALFKETCPHPWPGFRVDSFILWSSDLTPKGPVYTPLHTFRLKG